AVRQAPPITTGPLPGRRSVPQQVRLPELPILFEPCVAPERQLAAVHLETLAWLLIEGEPERLVERREPEPGREFPRVLRDEDVLEDRAARELERDLPAQVVEGLEPLDVSQRQPDKPGREREAGAELAPVLLRIDR